MKISKKSWHYRFLKFTLLEPLPNTLCSYVWTLLLLLIFGLSTLALAGIFVFLCIYAFIHSGIIGFIFSFGVIGFVGFVLSAAQYNKSLDCVANLDSEILDKHLILKYRVNNYLSNRNVRGMNDTDCGTCRLVVDDMAIASNYHFPCIIYLRQGGDPIGKVAGNFENIRAERAEWCRTHDCQKDPICKKTCLDVCVDYNNKARENENR